ncbi:hypothetical protein Hdeb2414_s0006g00218701 [Helianthus debilis subsp. tardiflorus]
MHKVFVGDRPWVILGDFNSTLHLKAHHDLQATPARPGKATRLGVRGSIVPAASQTSSSSFLKAGEGIFFLQRKKWSRFDSAQPNDTSDTNDLCLKCVARSLL